MVNTMFFFYISQLGCCAVYIYSVGNIIQLNILELGFVHNFINSRFSE